MLWSHGASSFCSPFVVFFFCRITFRSWCRFSTASTGIMRSFSQAGYVAKLLLSELTCKNMCVVIDNRNKAAWIRRVGACRCFWRRELSWSCPGKSCSRGCFFWWATRRRVHDSLICNHSHTASLNVICLFLQFNDALMYTTPVQSAQYKLNSVLSLAGMKVRDKHGSELRIIDASLSVYLYLYLYICVCLFLCPIGE